MPQENTAEYSATETERSGHTNVLKTSRCLEATGSDRLPRTPALRAWATVAAVALVIGCDAGQLRSSPVADTDSSAAQLFPAETGMLTVPPFLANSRAIDPSLLTPSLVVGRTTPGTGQVIPVFRNGNGSYSARITLPNDLIYPVHAVWSYSVTGRADAIPIAEATTNISLGMTERSIIFETYDTTLFNEDGDDFDNFTEIDQGSDPLIADAATPVTPRADQADCRDTQLPGEPADEAALDRDLFRFGNNPVSQTRALEFDRERRIYYATFFLETGGDIVIEHRSGLPTNTNAILYDRRAGAIGFDGSAIVSVLANPTDTSDGVPARIDTRLAQGGLYCYALLDEVAGDIATGPLLQDIVLLIEFTPGG